jgi:hypothetical protein
MRGTAQAEGAVAMSEEIAHGSRQPLAFGATASRGVVSVPPATRTLLAVSGRTYGIAIAR